MAAHTPTILEANQRQFVKVLVDTRAGAGASVGVSSKAKLKVVDAALTYMRCSFTHHVRVCIGVQNKQSKTDDNDDTHGLSSDPLAQSLLLLEDVQISHQVIEGVGSISAVIALASAFEADGKEAASENSQQSTMNAAKLMLLLAEYFGGSIGY